MQFWSSLNRIKKTVLLSLMLLFLLLLILVNTRSDKTCSIFGIPENATPIQLEQNGFIVYRRCKTNKFGKKFLKSIEQCSLENEAYKVLIRYNGNDTTSIVSQKIYIDTLAFHLMTGFKPSAYNYIQIEGAYYFVEYREEGHSMVAHRLNLAKE